MQAKIHLDHSVRLSFANAPVGEGSPGSIVNLVGDDLLDLLR